MESISITGYKGLSIVSQNGRIIFRLNNVELLGTTVGKTKSLGIAEEDFTPAPEYETMAVAWYNTFATPTYYEYLDADDIEELRKLDEKRKTIVKNAVVSLKANRNAETDRMVAEMMAA